MPIYPTGKLDFKDYKISQSDFSSMSAFEKRAYILQDLQEETMWWSRVVNITIVVSMIISVLAWVIWFTSQV
jgi:hypothetical protein